MDNNQNPTVYNAPQPADSPRRIWFRPKDLIYALIFIIAIELVWGLKSLLTPVLSKKVSSPPLISEGASLSLISSSKDYKIGDKFLVNVNLSTASHKTVGTDIVLQYDPKLLEATPGAFTKGTIYPDYPAVNIDNIKGIISASGVISPNGDGFKGSGVFGKIAFRAKITGQTILKLDFIKDATNDSNVFEPGVSNDILKEVNNLEINIQ